MTEGLSPEQDAFKGDFEDVHNEEFQKELRETGEGDKEFELTPEVEEKIMEKVQNIFQKDTAFTATAARIQSSTETKGVEAQKRGGPVFNRLCSIFKYGLLGKKYGPPEMNEKWFQDKKLQWAHDTRKYRETIVCFNIVSRMRDVNPERAFEYSAYISKPGNISIIFDISSYEETTNLFNEKGVKNLGEDSDIILVSHGDPGKSHSFRSADANSYRNGIAVSTENGHYVILNKNDKNRIRQEYEQFYKEKYKWLQFEDMPDNYKDQFLLDEYGVKCMTREGKVMVKSELGFVAYHRIPPKLLLGIVIAIKGRYGGEMKPEEMDITEITKAQMLVNRGHTERICPVYDSQGNLLWPRQMSYEEVKKFVAKRNKNKDLRTENLESEK